MNALAALIPPDAPISATLLEAFVLATLALVFLALARRDREPGLAWLSAGFGLTAYWCAFHAPHLPTSPVLDTVAERGSAAVLVVATLLTSLGVIEYLCGSARRGRAWLLMLVPCLVVLAPLAVGAAESRLAVNLAILVCYVALGVLALRQSREEPGHGHVPLALTLLAVPATFVVLVATRTVPGHYRVLAMMPLLVFGTTLLTVSLLRRRRALEAEVARRAAAEQALQEANRNLEATVRSRTHALEDLVSSLEAFNRSVSHDLRGPLGGIAGLARLAADALDSGDTAMVQRSLVAISAQAETSTKLVAALLQLARMGDADIAPRTVALDALTRDVITQLQHDRPDAAKAQWVVGTLPDVRADADLLRPVLVNLITNALKFSRDADPPIVRIDASADDGEVTVHVRDNGVGFDSAAAGQLFEPFARLHGRSFEGHGIGLSIVRRAVERHGGRVWAEAEPDRGAAFHFTLPRAA
ncbi:MAG TPA: HAMP domain-containing sensor histidine kinase [Burkholderiaceae bacterium]